MTKNGHITQNKNLFSIFYHRIWRTLIYGPQSAFRSSVNHTIPSLVTIPTQNPSLLDHQVPSSPPTSVSTTPPSCKQLPVPPANLPPPHQILLPRRLCPSIRILVQSRAIQRHSLRVRVGMSPQGTRDRLLAAQIFSFGKVGGFGGEDKGGLEGGEVVVVRRMGRIDGGR